MRQSGLNFGRMNSIYQTLSASRSLSEMCEIFQLPELAQKASQIPPFISVLSKKRPISEISTDQTSEDLSTTTVGLQPDHRFLFFFKSLLNNLC